MKTCIFRFFYILKVPFRTAKWSLVIGFLLLIVSCKNENNTTTFKSDFKSVATRTFISPQYWANPMQDWQVANDRIECLVSNENRNIHLLTRQLSEQEGSLEMRVRLGFFNNEVSNLNKNWAGFSIGSKGQFNDYRDNAVFGKGINIGVSTNGTLFIGKPRPNNDNNKNVIKALNTGVELKVLVSPKQNKYTIDFSVIDVKTGKTISHISKSDISPERLIGDVVLVSNFENKNGAKINNTKSVWFQDWEIAGSKIEKHDDRSFGPIMFSQYTLSRNTLKITAQMAPDDNEGKDVEFQIKENNIWKTISKASIDKKARTARFKIENWEDTKACNYRLAYVLNEANNKVKTYYWEGIIRKNPRDKKNIVVAGFTGNNDLGFPNNDIVEQVKYQNPDVLFFSGDQIYEPVGGYGIQREPLDIATLDYLRKWYMYGWAYREILKSTPTVVITDDHDMYMGNIWGENGKASLKNGTRTEIQDSGGYRMSPEWVNMVERTQTSHLPDPYDATSVERGIGVYYTQMNYGNVSFAIIEDRKFKSAPKALLPEAKIVNGWPQNKAYNIKKADVLSAKLLGDRQLNFLSKWSSDWSYGAEMKVLLSQTIFANVATLPEEAMTDAIVPTLRILKAGEYPKNDMPVTDMDSNGWPQTGRDNGVKAIRKGFAFHLAGDQHLGSTIQYGVDNFNDSGYAFCVPSISNYWPRRWYPMFEGENRKEGSPKYTGQFEDGFTNKITVEAISNPLYTNKLPSELHDRAAGYGIVRFNKEYRTIKMECWPRGANPQKGDSEQYSDWPITISQTDNFGKEWGTTLPKIKVIGLVNPVVQVIDEASKNILYTLRIKGDSFTPKVPKKGSYTIGISEPDKKISKKMYNIKASKNNTEKLFFDFN
ncbi:alkaline phosphatase D family protein [Maribacter sp.]|uniref:alkaline phosphatase D family protein n=1 Tax=Maribacter sp. TaxID=1897614 RepID=UPI0025B861EA|nr:alkaline phosphatase D family protein [Maribacter sp.]